MGLFLQILHCKYHYHSYYRAQTTFVVEEAHLRLTGTSLRALLLMHTLSKVFPPSPSHRI